MEQVVKKLGIFGGTFDPPHIGHLMIAQTALCELKLDKVLFIPCGNPPHKAGKIITNSKHRLAMVAAAIQSNNRFEVSDIELVSKEYSYTANTLGRLEEIYPLTELIFIVGADSLAYIKDWWHPEEIFARCTVAVVTRSDTSDEKLMNEIAICENRFNANILRLDMPKIDISASEIRECANIEKFRYFLPDGVREYIAANQLYSKQ